MTFSEPKDQTKFCLHFSNRIQSAPIILWKISQAIQKKFTFNISTGSTCNGEICVYVSKFVLFNLQYFEQLAEKLKRGNFEIAYSNYKRLGLKAFGRKNLILPPEWSPERFIQINYLGPVIALKDSYFESNRSLENFEIFEKIMKSKVVKINTSGYTTLFARNQDQPQPINYVTEFLSKNNSKVIATVQRKNRIKLRYMDLAPRKISVVIPTRGTLDNKTNKSLVYNLLKTINTQISSGVDIEVVVVYDNDTNLDYLQELKELSMNFSLKTVAYQPPFNFSKKCNLGAMQSSGDILMFLNDDTEFISQDALIELS
jgi:glycosyltransferase involved in cell wall biosynthesis